VVVFLGACLPLLVGYALGQIAEVVEEAAEYAVVDYCGGARNCER